MAKKTVTDDVVNAVINGDYGTGDARIEALTQEGYDADEVQRAVSNRIANSSGTATVSSVPTISGNSITYSSSGKPTYSSRYSAQIDSISNQLLNRQPFSYDHTTDENYKQYEKAYTRQGEIAMKDTLGQVAARTGGLASSYAGTASQQQYNSYMSALADKIPELRELAYNMYMNEETSMRNDLSTLLALEQNEFSRYQSELSDWYARQELAAKYTSLDGNGGDTGVSDVEPWTSTGEVVGAMVGLNTANAVATKDKYSGGSNVGNASNGFSNNSGSNTPTYINQHSEHISTMTPVNARKYLESQVDKGGLNADEALVLWNAYCIAPKSINELETKTGTKGHYLSPAAYATALVQGLNYTGYGNDYDAYLAGMWEAYLESVLRREAYLESAAGEAFANQYKLGNI